jgi:hypothetical protein
LRTLPAIALPTKAPAANALDIVAIGCDLICARILPDSV